MQRIFGLFLMLAGPLLFAYWARSSWPYAEHWAEPIVALSAFIALFFGPVIGGALVFSNEEAPTSPDNAQTPGPAAENGR